MPSLDRPPDNTTSTATTLANFAAPRPWRHVGTIAAAIVFDLSHRHRSGKAQAPRPDARGGERVYHEVPT